MEEIEQDRPPRSLPRWGFQRGLRRSVMFGAVALWLATLLFGGNGSGWDQATLAALYAGDNNLLAANARFLTRIGSWVVLVPATLVATILLAFSRRRRAALLLLLVFGGRLLVELQKLIVNRARPGEDPWLEAVNSMSFPSGHAANAAITYTAIALLVPVRHRNRAIAIGIGLALALQTGWSRIALGVHWPSDVIGAWAFATFWLMLCMRLASDRPEGEDIPRPRRRGTLPGRPAFLSRRRRNMADNKRGESARDHDDSEIIDRMEEGPSQSGVAGGNLQRDVASRAEQEHEVGGKPGVTRVTGEDKPRDGDVPTLPTRD